MWLRGGLGLLTGTLMMVCVKNRVEDKREKRRYMVGLWGMLFCVHCYWRARGTPWLFLVVTGLEFLHNVVEVCFLGLG